MPTFTFKIELMDTQPLVTRTFTIASESSMYLLHHVIQVVMGWKNYHLYQFTFDNLKIADKRLVSDELGPITDAKTIMVEDICTKKGANLNYEYDFGDGWEHQIELMEISNQPVNVLLPTIVSGQNSCPPEDCGGVHGYEELKKVLFDSGNEENKDMWEWVGHKFNPLEFNKKAAEKELLKLNKKLTLYEKGFKQD
jgi:hypothetical protein